MMLPTVGLDDLCMSLPAMFLYDLETEKEQETSCLPYRTTEIGGRISQTMDQHG